MFINKILDALDSLSKPQHKFLSVLFNTILVCQSRINFSSLARHADVHERTFRRNFRKSVDFTGINLQIIEQVECQIEAFAMDAAFIKKSGKKTFGIDKFWNGCSGRAEKGLEASIISLVDAQQNASFALIVDQTEPNLQAKESDSEKRKDADLKYLYEGEQKPVGRPREYDAKVYYEDLSRFASEQVEIEDKQIKLSSGVVWSVSLKRKIKLVVVKYKERRVNLFSTDVEMEADEVVQLYRSRFTIEFLIRDAKQSGGLEDCQARDNKAIEFHWNAALTTVNLGRGMVGKELVGEDKKPFSMKSIKQRYFNENLLKLFISKLGLEQTLIKYQESFEELRNYGAIAP